jgi:hypothetical protein
MINYKKNNLIKIISILFIVLFIFSINSVKAVDINPNLPGAVVSNTNNNPCTSVINFYWFAIFISGILAFGAIVYGGIKYQLAAGNPGGQSEGKKWITGALEGLLLLFSAYLILKIINPNLIKCQLPELSPLEKQDINLSGSGFGPGSECQPPSYGPCSTSSLVAYGGSCFSDPDLAAGVCSVESGGKQDEMSGTDKAYDVDGSTLVPVSIGLFQINISANPIGGLNCPSAFNHPFTTPRNPPTILNRDLYNQCVAAAKNMKTNIQEACNLSGNGTNFGLWGPATRQKCNIEK